MANHLFPASSRSVLSFSVAFRWIALRNRRNWLTFNLKIALYHRAWLIPSRTELGAFWATSKISFSHTVWNKEKNAHTHTHTHIYIYIYIYFCFLCFISVINPGARVVDTDKGARYHLFSFPCLTSQTAPLKFPPSPYTVIVKYFSAEIAPFILMV